MITDKATATNPLDVRIILAVLWAAGMLSSLNGDTYRLIVNNINKESSHEKD
ncbi:MAG: hypothetical protein KDE58_08035 [Caldilineaceae bacterium]|nr:hypothetical protein [Caldilineaceae bacterium]